MSCVPAWQSSTESGSWFYFCSLPLDNPCLFTSVKRPVGRISPCISWAVIISRTHPFSLQQTQDKWASLAPLHELRAERVLQMRLGIASPDGKVRQLCDTILCNQIPYYWKNTSHFGDSLVLCAIYATKSRHKFSFRWGKVKILKLQSVGAWPDQAGCGRGICSTAFGAQHFSRSQRRNHVLQASLSHCQQHLCMYPISKSAAQYRESVSLYCQVFHAQVVFV